MYWTKRVSVGWALPFSVVKIIRVQIVAILEILIVSHCVIFLFRNGENRRKRALCVKKTFSSIISQKSQITTGATEA